MDLPDPVSGMDDLASLLQQMQGGRGGATMPKYLVVRAILSQLKALVISTPQQSSKSWDALLRFLDEV
jgi:type IV secretory pathway ATPase VirB11/archaellum biosynthesis ATPase